MSENEWLRKTEVNACSTQNEPNAKMNSKEYFSISSFLLCMQVEELCSMDINERRVIFMVGAFIDTHERNPLYCRTDSTKYSLTDVRLVRPTLIVCVSVLLFASVGSSIHIISSAFVRRCIAIVHHTLLLVTTPFHILADGEQKKGVQAVIAIKSIWEITPYWLYRMD